MARKGKLTAALIKKISAYIQEGAYNVTACGLCNISEYAFYDWIKKAEADIESGKTSLYTNFLGSITAADADREHANIKIILQDDSWQSKAWYNERKYPTRWGKTETLKLKHGVDEEDAMEIRSILMSLTDTDIEHALKQADIKIKKAGTNPTNDKPE